ncbi:MAG: MFS transporter, partial [Chloroflexota bacterium]
YPDFARFVVASFVYRIGLNLPVALYSIYAVRDAHASNTIIGLQSTAGNLALVGSYLLWGRLAARRGHRIVLLLATAGLSFYPFATALVSQAVWLIPATLIWGTFASGIDVSFFEGLLHTCPADRLQTFIAVNSALANLVIFLAPIAGTLLADLVGIRVALVSAAALSLIGSALFYLLNVAKEGAPSPRVPVRFPGRTA